MTNKPIQAYGKPSHGDFMLTVDASDPVASRWFLDAIKEGLEPFSPPERPMQWQYKHMPAGSYEIALEQYFKDSAAWTKKYRGVK